MLDKLPPSSNDSDSATFGVDQTDSLLTVPIDDLDGELLEIIPHKDNDGIEDGVNLLQSLHDVRIEGGENVSQPHSFEVWYDRGEFHFFLEAATERARDRFQRRVSNVYPDAEVNPVEDGVGFPVIEPEMHRAGGWLKEQRHTFLPIKHHNAEGFETGDPYSDILGEMATLDNSLVVLQVIFKPAHPEWTHKGPDGAKVEDIAHDLRSSDVEDLTRLSAWNPLREIEEIPATKKDKQAAQIVEEQRGRQGFHANIRVLAASPDRYEAEERVRGTTSMFAKYYNSQTEQGLRAHGVAGDDIDRFYGSCITREWIDRSMILSIDELAGVAHVPSGEIEVPGIQWRHSKTGSDAPSTAPKDEVSESRDYSYSSQSGVSGGDDDSLSPTKDSRPTQTEPDAGSLLAESETEQSSQDDNSESSPTDRKADGGTTPDSSQSSITSQHNDGGGKASPEARNDPPNTDSHNLTASAESTPDDSPSTTGPDIPLSEIPEEFTVDDCPGCDAPRTYTQITLEDEKRWICESCGATVEPSSIPEYIDIQPADSESQSEEKEDTDDSARPIGMDRVQITPAEELFAEYVELLIASIPPDKQDQITAETTVRELIATIRELEAADELVPLSTGVLENTRPDTLSKDDVLSDGTVKLPSEMGVDVAGNDGLADRPIDALDVDPDEVEARGIPQIDRTPSSTDSAEMPASTRAQSAQPTESSSKQTRSNEAPAESDTEPSTETAASGPQDDPPTSPASTTESPADAGTPDSPAETSPSPPPAETAASDDGAWWGHAEPEHTTVEASPADTTEPAESTPFDDEWVDEATLASPSSPNDPEELHSPETEPQSTDSTH